MPSKDISSLNYDELTNTVRKCLEKEKFLLVLDDVWSVGAWEDIKAILPLENGEGKVLITTQEKNIGKRCINEANETLHNLGFLSIYQSWELLQYCLEDQLMKSQLNLMHELEMMSQSVSEALQNRVTRIAEVVGLSYHRLPNYLRGCFIFLGVFPEDYEIPAKMLCELWISEGFVLPRQGRSIEKSAEENMNDLIRRNLLEGVKTNLMGKVKACRVNAMIRAFCISIIKEENICEEVRQSSETGELETSGDTDLKSLEYVGREIVSKCEGLPLSICVIGGILRLKEYDLPEWKKVNANMQSYSRHGEGVEDYKRVKQMLELSYDALPYYLKPCFLYLACFPEDHNIDIERLYLLWMAEGFISDQDNGPNETLRDVAQGYLTELVMRCMVQLRKDRSYSSLNKFGTCGFHISMHDLCSSKAEEEKFLKRIDASKYLADIFSPTQRRLVIPPSIGNSESRLAINCDFERKASGIDGLEEVKGLRSFILFQNGLSLSTNIGFKESTIDFKTSQYLRIFVVEGCEFEGGKLPVKLGELIHLRYLSLHGSEVGELPKSIYNMPYLQTLDLRVHERIRLSNVICKMKRLKHLFLPFHDIEVIGGEKLRLDGLHELETLEWINSETTCIADIPKLISLQTLRVRVRDADSMSIVLSNKNSQLSVTCLQVELCDLSSEKDMEVLNEGLMSPSLVTLRMFECNMNGSFLYYKQGMCENLVTLELHNCKGKVDMEEFGKYPMLQELTVYDFVKMAETITFRSNSFPQLERLELVRLQDLKKWEVEKGAMPKLTSLLIKECPNLEKVPDGLRFSSSLRQMRIMNMPREFSERVKEEDYASFVVIRVLPDEENFWL
ncbi:putative disease resistance protein At1g59780 [Salvia hispanica]|uniref:putative disease resistance protein At1g59780 n=1 Tax=Salvia hispanica TaxID=49212 RepID=UPI0020092E61|nr:putative disease resistance protein At1g59780 [Salvia hispanica]